MTHIETEGVITHMPNKELFPDSKRANEDDFFYRRDRELIERARREDEAEAQRRHLGEVTGIADDDILRDLHQLGYNRETVALLNLAPLVEVAWSDGTVTEQERKSIFEVAQQEGVEEGGPGWRQLAAWLDDRPSEQLFHSTLRAIGATLRALPLEEGERRKRDLIAHCTRIASASGGILGLGSKINEVEWRLISRIAAELKWDSEGAGARK